MNLSIQLRNLILRGVVNRSADTGPRGDYQVATLGDRMSAGLEHLQPQGVYFLAPAGAEGLVVCPAGVAENAVAVLQGGATPGGEGVGPGEGGLHYLGAYKVFLNADGEVHLGAQVGTDAAALASRVDDFIATFYDLFSGWTAVPNDGGAALKVAFTAAFPDPPATVASTKVKISE